MKRNGSIRQQVQRLLFLCSVVSLLLLGGIALLGMMGARENSRQSGYEMGEEAALTVSTTLRKEAEERMHLLASERAAQIGLELQRIADRTNGMDVEHTDLSGILNTVQKSLAAHVGEAEQSDDITMMVLDYQGKQIGEV
ncbi:MAG: hypothetical protein E7201_06935 [Selenomonas ruminantium]|uniref:Uncharacterized protein n=1 Tax=Selenomonas ruminantium TaxID=971 RepID=A0A927ZRG6_SELRU|nr:hypothetical protein [Selenomonas ruminantium]